ncbi:hypothetical protein JCM3765_007893 [Sporobolomyces pararoseus]
MSTTREGFKLTTAQIIHSVFGYCGLGVAIACFVPLILQNAAKRRNGTGGLFLALWLIGDLLNIPAVVRTGAPLSQWFLAIWYLLADICLGIELFKWGHPGPLSRNPTPAKTLLEKREMERKHKWIRDFDLQFRDWGFWDNFKLVMACIFFGLGWWGIYFVAGLYTKRGDFEIEIPLSHDPVALGLGVAATLAFTIARLPEYFEGRQRHSKGEKPTQELSDGVFIFLILENLFNLLSILVLATDPSLREDNLWQTYLTVEIPWIAGGIIPIIFDALLVFSIFKWQRAWNAKPFPHKEDDEKRSLLRALEIDLERNRLARQHLEEQMENVEIKNEAELAQEQFQARKKKAKDQKGLRKGLSRITTAVGISHSDSREKSPVYEDYERHRSRLHHTHPTPASEAIKSYNRKHNLEEPLHHLSDHYTDSSASPTSPVHGDHNSAGGGNAPLLPLHSLSHSRSDSSSSSFSSTNKSRSRRSSRYFGV